MPKTKTPKITSQIQLAQYFEVHPTTIKSWIGMGCPGKKDGAYDVEKIALWRIKNIKNRQTDSGAPEKAAAQRDRKRELEEKLLAEKTRLAKVKAEEAEQKVVSKEEVDERIRSIAIAIRRVLLTMDEGLAPRLVGLQEREMKPVIKRFAREVCERLAQI